MNEILHNWHPYNHISVTIYYSAHMGSRKEKGIGKKHRVILSSPLWKEDADPKQVLYYY